MLQVEAAAFRGASMPGVEAVTLPERLVAEPTAHALGAVGVSPDIRAAVAATNAWDVGSDLSIVFGLPAAAIRAQRAA